jgi:hypothetical protein
VEVPVKTEADIFCDMAQLLGEKLSTAVKSMLETESNSKDDKGFVITEVFLNYCKRG